MTTTELFKDKDVLAFLQSQIASPNRNPWVFIYIPQTVTYAIRDCFADIVQPESSVVLRDEDAGLEYDDGMSAKLRRFETSEQCSQSRFVSGHFKIFHVDGGTLLSQARLMTVLRDPVDRL